MIIPRVVGDINVTLRRVLDAINGKLTFTENLFTDHWDISDTGPANTVFTINHNLQRIPVHYIWNIEEVAGTVYDYQRSSWTAKIATFKCSAPHAYVHIILL